MVLLGQTLLVAAFTASIYGVAAAMLGARRQQAGLVASARNAVYVTGALVFGATGTLIYLLLTDRFDVQYVAQNSRLEQPLPYKISALWGGMAGSLMLWAVVLAGYMVVAAWINRDRHPELMPWVHAVCLSTVAFFVSLMIFSANPFQVLPFTPLDGQGMNPLLQNPAMASHPPTLYLGYVGFTIPFAFALAALISGKLDTSWLHAIRRWTIVAWFFLSVGITLGAQWAYVELGWGGYWGWDPVENASFMPWLVATAYLHSVMMEEKKGMLRVWNMLMIIATFGLCIFGTFLTRSGIVSSVHAFATSNLGAFFAAYLAVVLALSLGLVAWRLPQLRSASRLESVLSRESSFLFNNLVLVVACFAVLWGTMFPVISEAVNGVKITVGPPFFNRVNIPIFLALLALTGIGPLIAWRRASLPSLRRAFVWPTGTFLATLIACVVLDLGGPYTWISLALSAFVTATVIQEFWRGGRARAASSGEGLALAMLNLTRRNKRRYGGYVIHVGIVLMAVGITGSGVFQTDVEATLRPGETVDVAGYRLQFEELDIFAVDGVDVVSASLVAFDGPRARFRMVPQRHFHPRQDNPTTEVAIWSGMRHDLYVVLAGWNNDEGGMATFKLYLNPLVKWIWIGGFVLMFGTLICLVPDRSLSDSGTANY
ncbi:MAG: heme lyase CcmF/NrfE family subunit [Acidobacteria bacterium]|nr:heme lyase CcmF/NrfE family subunit [Acidobacteriota bacterium]